MTRVIVEDGEYILRDDWHEEDVLSVDDTLTQEQVKQVMELISYTFDAEVGINWDVIDNAIDVIKARKGETK